MHLSGDSIGLLVGRVQWGNHIVGMSGECLGQFFRVVYWFFTEKFTGGISEVELSGEC